jgi:hypothetical protein
LIVGTSLLGAYSTVRGVSFIFGYFPSEAEIFMQLQNEEESEFDMWVLLYLVAIIAAFVLGFNF